MRLVVLVATVITGAGACGGALGADDLCGPGEQAAFSCATSRGIASLCRGIGPSGDSLHYRFGRPGKIALDYPAAGSRAGSFRYGGLMFSGGGGAYVQFSRGATRYTVLDATGRWGRNGTPTEVSGVAVDQAGREIANLRCQPTTLRSSLGDDLFRQLGLQPVDSSEDYEIPEAFFPN